MTQSTLRQRVRFLFAEFVVIVVGVLVALGVDQFMAERQDRVAERDYASRLVLDLASDTVTFAWFRQVLDTKAEVLQQLLDDATAFGAARNAVRTMSSLTYSTFVGLPPIDASTFQELQGSGHLDLIHDPILRSKLTAHYARYARMTTILDDRFGSYREIVFASIPGSLQYAARSDSLNVDVESLRVGLSNLAAHPDLERAANAELAYTASMTFYLEEARVRARDLLRTLDAEYSK